MPDPEAAGEAAEEAAENRTALLWKLQREQLQAASALKLLTASLSLTYLSVVQAGCGEGLESLPWTVLYQHQRQQLHQALLTQHRTFGKAVIAAAAGAWAPGCEAAV